MTMFTRRRLMGIGLSLSALAGVPKTGWAQRQPKDPLDCPKKQGTISDWSWFSSSSGWFVSARNVSVVERGDYMGDPALTEPVPALEIVLKYDEKDLWSLDVFLGLSRKPSDENIAIEVGNGVTIIKTTFPTASFERRESSRRRENTEIWVSKRLIDLSPIIRTGHIDPAQSMEITLDFFDGTKTLCRFKIGTKGFAEAAAMATLEAKPIKAMLERKTCKAHELPPTGCYLTTLCVEQIGLPDDCFELKTMRAWRDTALTKLPGGPQIIEDYYRIAPRIVFEIKRRGDEMRFLRFYVSHLLPTVFLAKLGCNRTALWRFRGMMRQLQRRYEIKWT